MLDPFLGSASTLIAVGQTGRICRDIERDLLYVDVMAQRYEATTRSAAVLAERSERLSDLAARTDRGKRAR